MKRLGRWVIVADLLFGLLAGCTAMSGPELAGAQSTPTAPVLSAANTTVVTRILFGFTYSLVLLRWSHADPGQINAYEVWQATNEPYFTPENCARCELVGKTRAQWLLLRPVGLTFNPIAGTPGAVIGSAIVTYKVRALNRKGLSPLSNEIGVITWSEEQGNTELSWY